MGVIKRQSIKTSIIEILGIGVGFFSMLFIYPLNDEAFGYIQFLVSSSTLLMPLLSFGLGAVLIKFFSKIGQSKEERSGFFFLICLLTLIPISIFLIIYNLFKHNLYEALELLKFDVSLFEQNEGLLLILGLLMVYVSLCVSYLSNFGKIAFPSLIKDFGFKIASPIIVLLCFYNILSIQEAGLAVILFYFLVFGIVFLYAYTGNTLTVKSNLSFHKSFDLKAVTSFSFYSSLTYLSSFLAFRLDLIMIASLISLTSNGIYAKILIISAVISLPSKVLRSTISPSIAASWNRNDITQINKLYKISGTNMIIYGLLIFIVIWFVIDDLFAISSNPQSFENGKLIFLFLGIGRLTDLMASINGTIIGYSPSYRFNFVFILLMGISNVFFNYFLIGKYEVIGAAMATCFAFILFNFFKLAFLYIKYKLNPFSLSMIKTVLIAMVVFGLVYFMPSFDNPIINLISKPLIISFLFLGIVLALNVSHELNESVKQVMVRLRLFLK